MRLSLFSVMVLVLADATQCGIQAKSVKAKLRAYSCLDHLKAGSKSCGAYPIYDDAGNSFPVYCDMKSEPGNAWTLVMSWSTKYRSLPQFQKFPFYANSPVNENEPNFSIYRQNLARMNSIKRYSTHWRSTCSFPTHKVDYVDYVRGNFKEFEIMTKVNRGFCPKVEYINIRGQIGIHTTANWFQANDVSLHLDNVKVKKCDFAPLKGSVRYEDIFGHYVIINPNFRCTANDESTTQWWFGGHI